MILLSYDGSADAQAAIDHAARIMPGAEATVLTVWEPFLDAVARSGAFSGGVGVGPASPPTTRRSTTTPATSRWPPPPRGRNVPPPPAWSPTPRSARRQGSIADSILAAAADEDADAIVLGTRGLGKVKSFLLGSVSHAVAQHADRPVLVVPSPERADQRRDHVAEQTPGA